MSPFENIVGAIHDLSYEEKLKLRVVLDDELKTPEAGAGNGTQQKSGLIGLFSDEPELIDEVMQSVYEHRSRPLRLKDE